MIRLLSDAHSIFVDACSAAISGAPANYWHTSLRTAPRRHIARAPVAFLPDAIFHEETIYASSRYSPIISRDRCARCVLRFVFDSRALAWDVKIMNCCTGIMAKSSENDVGDSETLFLVFVVRMDIW